MKYLLGNGSTIYWPYWPFFFSVNSKALTLFFPLLVLFHLKYQRGRWRRATLLTLPFLALSAYYGYRAYAGAFSYRGERSSQRQLVKKAPSTVAKTKALPSVVKDVPDKREQGEASKPMASFSYRGISLGKKDSCSCKAWAFILPKP